MAHISAAHNSQHSATADAPAYAGDNNGSARKNANATAAFDNLSAAWPAGNLDRKKEDITAASHNDVALYGAIRRTPPRTENG